MTRFATVLIALSLLGPSLSAEEVVLKSGKHLEGRIIQNDERGIVIEVETKDGGTARLTIPMGEIAEIRTRPLEHDELIAKGYEYLKKGNLEAARSDFLAARSSKLGSAEAYHGLARVAWKGGNPARAIEECRKGIILVRSHPGLHRTLGILYGEVGDYHQAIKTLERAIALKPFSDHEVQCRNDIAHVQEMAQAAMRRQNDVTARQRRDFDPDEASNMEASGLAGFARKVIDNLEPDLTYDLYVEVRAPSRAEQAFVQGGPVAPYRSAVQFVQFSLMVNPVDWATMTYLERKQLVGGWIRYAKDIYPYATVFAVVHNTRRIVFEAIWSDLRHDVIFHERRPSDS